MLTEEAMTGEDDVVHVDGPEWASLESDGLRWADLAAFAAGVEDESARRRLEQAIEGRGAFRRLRDAVEDLGLREEWLCYRDEVQYGRVRADLAAQGIRLG